MTCSATRDYYRIIWTGSGDISADGHLFAYVRTHVEEPCNEINEIVLRDVATGQEHVIGRGTNPLFSPDSSRLLTTRQIDGHDQLVLSDLGDGSEHVLTEMRFGVEGAVWSPDGNRIAFISEVETDIDSSRWAHPATPDELERERRQRVEHPYYTTEEWAYKSDEVGGFSVNKALTLWSIESDKPDAAPQLLSDRGRTNVMPVFTPDGKTVVFASNRCRTSEESIAMDLFRVPAAGGEITRITSTPWVAWYPASFQPSITPDGKWIVFGALAPVSNGNMPCAHLFKVPLAGEGENGSDIEDLWPDDAPCHEATCFVYNCENLGAGSRTTSAISPDGRWLYFISGWKGTANLYRASLQSPHIEAVTQDNACYRSIKAVGTTALVSRGTFTETPQLFSASFDQLEHDGSAGLKKLTADNAWFEDTLVKPEELWIDTLDGGSRVQGWVFKPQEFEEGHTYPAVVYIHGGPTPFFANALTYEHQCILGAGIGLIIMNFRGSSGYGPAHQDMGKAYDGTAMYDILQFVDEALRRYPWIDGSRLGVTGGSFGGYMTNWLCGHAHRFKAAVTQRSISNELIMYASSDMPGTSQDFNDFSDFMRNRIDASPVSYAEKIDVPFLILHGTSDMRCPVENAHQLFCAVKETHPDMPVRMVLFPGMTHEFPMSGPMDLRIAHYDAMIDWFKKYL